MGMKKKSRRAPGKPLEKVTIADALFGGTQQRVLGFLFGQPEKSFYASELIQLSGSGSGVVQRELTRLSASGLVTTRDIGRQRHYQANRSSPVYEELHAIVLKTGGVPAVIRAALAPMADRIQRAFLYGSIAKGTATAASDIDILVVADSLPLELLFSSLALAESQLGRKISPLLLLPDEFAKRKSSGNPFLKKTLSGPTINLLGDES
jgi:predicted nucleotidyltransferase